MSGLAFADLEDLGEPVEATLRDGETVRIRPSVAADEPALGEFLEGLCLEARRLRFFSAAVDIAEAAHLSAGVGTDRLGMSAFDQAGELVGHGVCIEFGPGQAEVAVEVADRLHGQGLGTILLERLAEVAERQGISRFVAEVLPENEAMLEVFRDGFDAKVRWDHGVEHVEFPTAAWRSARERFLPS